jgi:hypothetical protein
LRCGEQRDQNFELSCYLPTHRPSRARPACSHAKNISSGVTTRAARPWPSVFAQRLRHADMSETPGAAAGQHQPTERPAISRAARTSSGTGTGSRGLQYFQCRADALS